MSRVERLLVLVGAAVADVDELPADVRDVVECAEEMFVVTPTLASNLQWPGIQLDVVDGAAVVEYAAWIEASVGVDVAVPAQEAVAGGGQEVGPFV